MPSFMYRFQKTIGLRMLRVAAKVRSELGHEPIGPLYEIHTHF